MKVKRNYLPVDAILTSDWHMMEPERNPPCRLDSHYLAQGHKVKQIRSLQMNHVSMVWHAGDLFEHWKASPELINHCFDIFPHKMQSIVGQHDLPQHSLDLIHKSGFASLVKGKKVVFLTGQGHWGINPKRVRYMKYKGKRIVIAHMLVWKDDLPFPGSTAPQVDKVFKMFPKADLIVTGDNHLTFTARQGNRILVNPGSLTRHKADQIDHRPCVFLWNADTNTIRKHYLKIDPDVISRDHIDEINDKKDRGEAFISSLDNEWLASLSFKDNIKVAIDINKMDKRVTQYIHKWLEETK